MLIPPALLEEHPVVRDSLQVNQQRLVTAFDIHETIKGIINLGLQQQQQQVTVELLPARDNSGISMVSFPPIPKNRTCTDAQIEPHWCACMSWYEVDPASSLASHLANLLMAQYVICCQ
jgi:hypothetical protein